MEEKFSYLRKEIEKKHKVGFILFAAESFMTECQYLLKKKLFKSKREQILDWISPEEAKVAEVRIALAKMQEKPLYQYRVFFLGNISFLDRVLQNTLLKSLEEAKTGQVYLLFASSEEGVLPTILSRCRKIYLFEKSNIELTKPFFLDKKLSFSLWLKNKPKDINEAKELLFAWANYLKTKKKFINFFPIIFNAYWQIKKINLNLDLFWFNLYIKITKLHNFRSSIRQ